MIHTTSTQVYCVHSNTGAPIDVPTCGDTMSYRDISAIARTRRDVNIATFFKTPATEKGNLPNNLRDHAFNSGYFTSQELAIMNSEAQDIIRKIRDQVWTALEVTQAFCKASAFAQQLVSGLLGRRGSSG